MLKNEMEKLYGILKFRIPLTATHSGTALCSAYDALFDAVRPLPQITSDRRVRCELTRNISGVRGVFY